MRKLSLSVKKLSPIQYFKEALGQYMMYLPMPKRILYLSDYELRALEGKTLSKVHIFHNEDDFANYLRHDSKTPIYWIIDTTQEEYQIASLPHVIGKDRRHLIVHKMKRLFKGMPYTYGVVQGREMQGRRDDQILFTALSNPALLQPWLKLIAAHKVPLVGIYSLPLLSQELLKYLPQANYTLLLAHTPPIKSNSVAGLRQSFFINQKLQFSRLNPLNTLEPQEYAESVLTQVITTKRYLANARRLFDQQLSTVILTPLVAALKQSLSDDLSPIHILDNRDFTPLFEDGDLHRLVAFQLNWQTRNHYASQLDTRYFLYRRLRMGIYFLSLLLLLGGVGVSAVILEKAFNVQQVGQQIADKTAKRLVELEQLNKKKPNLPLDILLIRNIVDVGHHIKAHHLSPQAAWQKLSHVLNRHPDLFLERLEWGTGHFPSDIFDSNAIENEELVDLTKEFLEGMRLHGKIHPFDGNYQNALDIFNQFINDLGSDFWKIKVQRFPYDSKQILQGQIGLQNKVGNAPFVVDILIKHNLRKFSR